MLLAEATCLPHFFPFPHFIYPTESETSAVIPPFDNITNAILSVDPFQLVQSRAWRS